MTKLSLKELFEKCYPKKSLKLTLWYIMSQDGQTHFKNLAAKAARFLKCIWPFWDIMHERVDAQHATEFWSQIKKSIKTKYDCMKMRKKVQRW